MKFKIDENLPVEIMVDNDQAPCSNPLMSNFHRRSLFLVTEMWQGVPFGVGRLVRATLLGVMGPPSTWDIVKHCPETDWLAWRLMTTTGGLWQS
jgi:hypothetical protein